jgi:hypothetical protein
MIFFLVNPKKNKSPFKSNPHIKDIVKVHLPIIPKQALAYNIPLAEANIIPSEQVNIFWANCCETHRRLVDLPIVFHHLVALRVSAGKLV